MGISIILNVSLASFNIGLIVIFNELNIQFQMLLDELRNAFKYRTEEKFKKLFVDCVYHHQLIIKYVRYVLVLCTWNIEFIYLSIFIFL